MSGGGTLESVTQRIACVTFAITLTLLTCVTAAIFYPYRLFVLALSRILRPDLAECIQGLGNVAFAFGSNTVPTANVCICLTVDGVITVEQVRRRFQKNFLDVRRPDGSKPYSKLEQTITSFMNYGFYRWVKDFKLNEHIRPYDYKGPLALPTNEGVTEKDLERIAGKLISLPYAPGRSHWELLVVSNYRPEGNGDPKTLGILRISHAIADGYSIQGLLLSLTDTPNLISQLEPPINGSKFWPNLWRMTVLPVRMLRDAAAQAADLMGDERSWAVQRQEGEQEEIMAVFTKAIHIDTIKTIKNIHGVSYASVLLTALSSSIHRAMRESGQRIPEKMYCMLPFPKPKHPGGLTNHLLVSILPFPVVPDVSPSSLAQVDAHFKKLIRSTLPLWIEFTVGIIVTLPLCLVKLAYSAWQPSTAVGIFPVISHKLGVDGKLLSGAITFIGALAFPATNGATISMGGVNGLQRISICMDRRAFPNEEVFSRLPRYIEDEIDNLLQASKTHTKSCPDTLDCFKKHI